jgi:hypothetical protein
VTLASDDDREATAERLRRAYAAGRLTQAELTERVGGAYAARTHAELATLEHDLPGEPARAPVPAAASRGGFSGGQIAAAVLVTVFVPFGHLVGLVVALAMRSGEPSPERRRQLA